jgi:hypothetical protein
VTSRVEHLSQGKEPSPGRLPDRARAVLGAGLCMAVAAAGALTWKAGNLQSAAGAATQRRVLAVDAAPAPAQLLTPAGQVRISTGGQHAYVTSRGHVDLDLQLVNDGDFPLALLGARMPQPGVRPDPGPGGLVSAPSVTELPPGTPTAVTVHLVVLCPQGLAGPAADHLDLTLDDPAGSIRSAWMDLRALPGFWDRVRRNACAAPASATGDPSGVVPLVVSAVPTSVRWQGGTTSG